MSGHSKWAQIQHEKAVTDARRGRRFSGLIQVVTVAARLGGTAPALIAGWARAGASR